MNTSATSGNAAERKTCIQEHEAYLLSLPYDKAKYSNEIARGASKLIAVLANLDSNESPILIESSHETMSQTPTEDESSISLSCLDEFSSTDDGGRMDTSSYSICETITDNESESIEIELDPIVPKTAISFLARYKRGRLWTIGSVVRYSEALRRYEVDVGEKYVMVNPNNIRVLKREPPPFKNNQRVLAVYPGTNRYFGAKTVDRNGDNWLVEFDDEDESCPKRREVIGQFIMLLDCSPPDELENDHLLMDSK
eukprot:IDg5910t1